MLCTPLGSKRYKNTAVSSLRGLVAVLWWWAPGGNSYPWLALPGWYGFVHAQGTGRAGGLVAGLHAVKCLVAWGTLGKRLTSGKVNFLHASVRFHFHEARGFGEWLQGLNYIYNYICSGWLTKKWKDIRSHLTISAILRQLLFVKIFSLVRTN